MYKEQEIKEIQLTLNWLNTKTDYNFYRYTKGSIHKLFKQLMEMELSEAKYLRWKYDSKNQNGYFFWEENIHSNTKNYILLTNQHLIEFKHYIINN